MLLVYFLREQSIYLREYHQDAMYDWSVELTGTEDCVRPMYRVAQIYIPLAKSQCVCVSHNKFFVKISKYVQK